MATCLTLGGHPNPRVVSVINSYAAVVGDIIVCTNTSSINITLPSAQRDDMIEVKRRGSEVVVIGTIDGLTNKTINVLNYSMRLVYNGTGWNEI